MPSKSLLKAIVLFIFASCISNVVAQAEDFKLRLGVDLSGDLNNDFDWSVVLQQRFEDNSRSLDRSLIQAKIAYSPFAFLKFDVAYRSSYVYHVNKNNVLKHRTHASAMFKTKVDRFRFSYRARLQYGFDDFGSIGLADASFKSRHKFNAKYSPFGISLEPSIGAELFILHNNVETQGIEGVRYHVGCSYGINRNLSISVFYLQDVELNTSNPSTDHILSFGLGYAF